MSRHVWGIWAAGGLSLAVMGAGGALALRSLSALEAAPALEAAQAGPDGCCPNPTVHDRKAPSAFGLPAYPGAAKFHSLETDAQTGSVSFSLQKDSAAEVARFYRKSLPERGWKLDWERPARETTQVPGGKQPKILKGLRQSWTRAEDDRVLLLLAVDYPQKRSSAQAVLSWSPKKAEK